MSEDVCRARSCLSVTRKYVSILTHPLAGKDLFFKGEILGVRDATDEELEALHSHKCGGCSGCGSEGGCGSHDEAADAEDVTKYIRNTFCFLCPVIL